MINRPAPLAYAPLELLGNPDWQMSFGERAALEGVLAQLSPRLSIEIGTAGGGSLAAIRRHSAEVHSFDLEAPDELADRFPDVHFHTGDSHDLLPRLLETLAAEGRNVDFVLVDGDHSSEGVERDIHDLLASPAVSETVIVLHDTSNAMVRGGIERASYAACPKVAFVELDFVAGYVMSSPGLDGELWGGLGFIWVSERQSRYLRHALGESPYHSGAEILRAGRDAIFGPAS